jgi:hypothetical protein
MADECGEKDIQQEDLKEPMLPRTDHGEKAGAFTLKQMKF